MSFRQKHEVNLPHYYLKRRIFTQKVSLWKNKGGCIKCQQTKGQINGKSCSLLTISQSVNVLKPPAPFLYSSPTLQACLFNMQVGGRFRTWWVTTAWKKQRGWGCGGVGEQLFEKLD